MINRVCTLTENAQGKPRKNNFPDDVDHISEQTNNLYICYRNARHRRHKAIYILYKHSANLYCIFTRRGRAEWLELSPRNGLRLRAYTNQPVHGWRIYYADGTDSALPPGSQTISDRLIRLTSQPPVLVNEANPLILGTFTITNIRPTIGISLGEINLTDISNDETDRNDVPSEDPNND